MSERLANSVDDRVQEFIKAFTESTDRHCTDSVTYVLGVNYMLKHTLQDIKDLICDSGVDGRFRKGSRRK